MDEEAIRRSKYVISYYIRQIETTMSSSTVIPIDISQIILVYMEGFQSTRTETEVEVAQKHSLCITVGMYIMSNLQTE